MMGSASRLVAGLSRLGKVSSRRVATSSVSRIGYSEVPKDLQGKMSLFQVDNGLPVHIKGGILDKLLMVTTYFVCTVGLIECFHVYYVFSYPAKKED